ncbi:hypothetical protein GCM10010317_094260 [Streptomyces mirabilis]|uniref:hypothetical protein n=1 Tax=Streptomyces mirabilis TaxID=68239 RepID=UPI00167CEBD1|nr:hypothetical protein [Streptomyces mirabilis]GHD77010.1 hypothetical protein GCM10010317_094260 [Streptomyces mirabilis]
MPSRDQRVAQAFRAITSALGPGIHYIVVSAHLDGILGRVVAGTCGSRGTCAVRGWLIAAGWFHAMGATEILDAPRVMPHGCLAGGQPGLSFEDGSLIPRARAQPHD